MASFNDVWSSLAQPGKPMPFMLIDCAGIEGGAAQLPRHIFSEFECLFAGTLAVELGDVGPYLGRIKSFNTEVAKTVEDLLARQVGMLVLPEDNSLTRITATFSQLHRHFRKFNTVEGPDGTSLFFRYYDPRVIMNVLIALDTSQVEEFFGPVKAFMLTGKNKQTTTVSKEQLTHVNAHIRST